MVLRRISGDLAIKVEDLTNEVWKRESRYAIDLYAGVGNKYFLGETSAVNKFVDT